MIVPKIRLGRAHVTDARRAALAGCFAVDHAEGPAGLERDEAALRAIFAAGPCILDGGFTSANEAVRRLDAGAHFVTLAADVQDAVIGSLPAGRVFATVDLDPSAGLAAAEARVAELRGRVAGILVRTGDSAPNLTDAARSLRDAAGDTRLVIAASIVSAQDIAALDALGADALAPISPAEGGVDLADALLAPMRAKGPAPWPVVVADERGLALDVRMMDDAALKSVISEGHSAMPGRAEPAPVLRLVASASRAAFLMRVRLHGAPGGFAAFGGFGDEQGLADLARRLAERSRTAPPGSYTHRLLNDPQLLQRKLLEEARELAEAESHDHVVWETADVFYFALVAMVRGGATLEEVEAHLDARALAVTRRPDKP